MSAQHTAAGLDPLVITSPSTRCGTTLLQRVLCSSRRALIFGERCGKDLDLYLNLYLFKSREYAWRKPALDSSLNRVLEGNTDDWILELMPDVDRYLDSLAQASFGGLAACRAYTSEVGRPVWGFKMPGWKPASMQLLRSFLPKSRFIYIYRDVASCVRSAKAQHEIGSLQALRDYCTAWMESLTFMFALAGDPNILLIDYADLLAERERTLQRIAQFTSLDDLDERVLERKINTWTGDEYVMQSPDGYRPPAELSDAEQQIIADLTAPLSEPLSV